MFVKSIQDDYNDYYYKVKEQAKASDNNSFAKQFKEEQAKDVAENAGHTRSDNREYDNTLRFMMDSAHSMNLKYSTNDEFWRDYMDRAKKASDYYGDTDAQKIAELTEYEKHAAANQSVAAQGGAIMNFFV